MSAIRWRWFLPLFAASGCAALIYEVVWFQMLQLVIGSTAVSLAVLLASFMGGLCLGSILLPKAISPRSNPVRVWALLELSIGLLGLAVLLVMPSLAKAYAAWVPGGLTGFVLRGLLSAICLLPPTILMGATLPVIARMAPATGEGASLIGLLYGANTFGAVFGALLAGFVLLRLLDSVSATAVAIGLNVAIATIGFALCRSTRSSQQVSEVQEKGRAGAESPGNVYLVLAVSGFCALGAEVVWTRLLSLTLGGTTYTFSIILAVFLLGLGSGSAVGAMIARRTDRPAFVLGLSQWLLAPAIGWAALMLNKSLPYWPINPGLSTSVWFNFQLDLLRCLWAIFPATCLWGVSFPLGLAAAAKRGADSGLVVGRLYAANTLGAIFGAIFVSVVLIAWLGTQQAQRVLIGLSAVTGLLAHVGLPKLRCTENARSNNQRLSSTATVSLSLAILSVGLIVWSVPAVPWPVIAYGRYLPQKSDLGTALFVGEGMNASVAVTELSSGVRNFHVPAGCPCWRRAGCPPASRRRWTRRTAS